MPSTTSLKYLTCFAILGHIVATETLRQPGSVISLKKVCFTVAAHCDNYMVPALVLQPLEKYHSTAAGWHCSAASAAQRSERLDMCCRLTLC